MERFSLGNWNSIVKNDKIFPSVYSGLINNMEQGRPVRLHFAPSYVIRTRYASSMSDISEVNNVRTESFKDINDLWEDDEDDGGGWPRGLRNKFLKSGDLGDPGDSDYVEDYYDNNHELKNHLKMNFSDGFGYIQERTESDIENGRFRIKLDQVLKQQRQHILDRV